jgi:hypothetical protein
MPPVSSHRDRPGDALRRQWAGIRGAAVREHDHEAPPPDPDEDAWSARGEARVRRMTDDKPRSTA